MNLIASSTIPHIWTRHVADSLQLLALAPQALRWADLGSGAGFPGMVIACALVETRGAHVHLIESIGKKAAFLRDAVRETGVPATVHRGRIEDIAPQLAGKIDVATARALAPLNELLTMINPFLERGAQALLLKGQDIDVELTQAAKYWTRAHRRSQSDKHDRRIMIVRRLQRRGGHQRAACPIHPCPFRSRR